MLRRMLAIDGVDAVARFRDDGAFVEGYGVLPEDILQRLAAFAHDYKRMVQGNADQLAMFTQKRGWTPPGGWIVHAPAATVCSVGNLVCLLDNAELQSLDEVIGALREAATY